MSEANKVYRGPVDQYDHPFQAEGPAVDAFLPGAVVTESPSGLTKNATADEVAILIAKELGEGEGGNISTEYQAGEYAYAYRIQSGQIFNARVAIGNYSVGDKLYATAAGNLGATGTVAVATAYETLNVTEADSLLDVRVL